MGYLGTPPQSGFITTAKQRVTSSTNNYVDLDHSISSIADVIVFVNFVKQDTTNLTLTTSTRITLGGTLVSSDVVEIHYLGKAVNTQTPSAGTVTSDMLAGSIANDKLANSSITLNGSAVSLGGSATVGGNNKPLVSVYASADTSMSDNTYIKVPFNTENFDADNTFDNSTNYRFVAPNDGKYLITTQVGVQSNSDNGLYSQQTYLAKNGSEFIGKFQNFGNAAVRHHYDSITVLASLSQNDYIEVFTRADWYQASSSNIYGGSKNTFINILELIT